MGTHLVLAGDLVRLGALYSDPVSLLWRDAGALLQTLALVSNFYRLAFCPLGNLGFEVVAALGLKTNEALALGCAVVGRADEPTLSS